MQKWTRCKCGGWVPPGTNCSRCEARQRRDPQPDLTEERVIFRPETPAIGRIVEEKSLPKENFVFCDDCRELFDAESPEHKPYGKYTQCSRCAEAEKVVRYSGVMVFGGKNACEIQINTDPKLTEYMLGASVKHSAAPTPSKKGGTALKVVTGLENRRHGDSK